MTSILRRLSVILLLILSIVLLAGIVIPQKGLSEDDYRALVEFYPRLASLLNILGFTEIHSSPLWYVLVAALTVNIALCSLYRIKPLIRRSRPEAPSASEMENLKERSKFSLDSEHSPPELLARLRSRLSSRRYRMWIDDKGPSFRAVKNRLAPFGSLIFHLSFIIFLIGGILSIKTRFMRNVILAEGQSFSSREMAEGKVGVPDLRMRVEEIKPVYEGESYLTDLSGRVKIYYDRKEDEATIKVNRPFTYKSTSILLKDFGITLLYILRDAAGKELDGAFVNLGVLSPGSEDHFAIAGTPYTAYVRFFADYVFKDGEHSSRSLQPQNPAFQIEIKDGARIAFEGLIMRGESADFDGFSLTFPRIRYWGRFTLIKDRGKHVIFAGFLIALLGLAWRLLFYRKEIVGLIVPQDEGSRLQVSWKSDLNPKLFAEETKMLLQEAIRR